MSPLWSQAATFWAKGADGSWTRSCVSGCHVEATDGSAPASPGPTAHHGLKVFIAPPAPDIAPGDWCVPVASEEATPPDAARRVGQVKHLVVGGAIHHTEVSCP